MSDPINLPYTICFVRAGDRLLLINRAKPPHMGLWNGIGGSIEKGETPLECIIREVWEEAGLSVQSLRFAGIVTWVEPMATEISGMYAYVADVDESRTRNPEATAEGILSWFPVEWVKHIDNQGVVSNIPFFLHSMLNGVQPLQWHCSYKGGRLVDVDPRTLTINLEGV